MAAPTLALPPAGGTGGGVEARRGIFPLASAIAGASLLTVIGGLVAAYLALRSESGVWPPEDTSFDNYTAAMLTITVVMGMLTIEWAVHAIRIGFRGQALVGFGLTALFGAAHLVGLAYLINDFDFEAGSSPYAAVVHALCVVAFVAGSIGTGAVVLTGLRAAGHQLATDNISLLRGAALLWHAAAIAWIVVHYTVYVSK